MEHAPPPPQPSPLLAVDTQLPPPSRLAQAELVGSYMDQIVRWVQSGEMSVPTVDALAMEHVPRAHELIQSGQTVGKLVCVTPAHPDARGPAGARGHIDGQEEGEGVGAGRRRRASRSPPTRRGRKQ